MRYTIAELGVTRKYRSGLLWRAVQLALQQYTLPPHDDRVLCRILRLDGACDYAASGEYCVTTRDGQQFHVQVDSAK